MLTISKTIVSDKTFVHEKHICMRFRITESNTGKILKIPWAPDKLAPNAERQKCLTCLI